MSDSGRSERLADVRQLKPAGNHLEDEALVRARPERDYEVRLLAGYGVLYRRASVTQRERRLVRGELILLVHSLRRRFDEDTLMEMRGDLHARDVRVLLSRPEPELALSPERTRLRERGDAEGFHWYQQRRNDEVRERLDRRIDRAVVNERAAIASWLHAHGVHPELAEAVRRGFHHDGPGGGAALPAPAPEGSVA